MSTELTVQSERAFQKVWYFLMENKQHNVKYLYYNCTFVIRVIRNNYNELYQIE